jgi:hypothetical protein
LLLTAVEKFHDNRAGTTENKKYFTTCISMEHYFDGTERHTDRQKDRVTDGKKDIKTEIDEHKQTEGETDNPN